MYIAFMFCTYVNEIKTLPHTSTMLWNEGNPI